MNDELVEDPVFNYRIRFHPQEGEILRMDIYVDADGGVSIPHYHPAIEERFTVLEGETTFTADGEKVLARAGDETVVVRPGVRHSFKNTGDSEAHIVCEAEPAMDLRGFLTEAAAMACARKYTRHGIPRGFRPLLEAAEFTDRYRNTVVVTGRTFPPPKLQPALLGPLARWQRRRTGSRDV